MGNVIITVLPSCLLDHLQLLQKYWSDHTGPRGFWVLKRVHYNPKCSYCTATEHLLVQPWQSKSENLGSQKLFAAVISWISPCPLSHQEEEGLQRGQDSSERAGWGTNYVSKAWSPSVILLLLLRQGSLTCSQPWSQRTILQALRRLLDGSPPAHFLFGYIYKPLSLVTESYTPSRSWNPWCRFFKFFCLQRQERSEKGGVATPLHSLSELSYHRIPDSPDPLCSRVAQIYQWVAVIN